LWVTEGGEVSRRGALRPGLKTLTKNTVIFKKQTPAKNGGSRNAEERGENDPWDRKCEGALSAVNTNKNEASSTNKERCPNPNRRCVVGRQRREESLVWGQKKSVPPQRKRGRRKESKTG